MAYGTLVVTYVESPETPANKSSPFIPERPDYYTSDYTVADPAVFEDAVYTDRQAQCTALVGGSIVLPP